MERNLPIARKYWTLIPTCVQTLLLGVLGKLWEQISDLRDQVEQLRKEVGRLKERANRNSRNSSFPPSSDKPDVKRPPPKKPSGRKKGGQKGHPKHQRELAPPDQVTQTISCKPTTCGQCGEKLDGEDTDPHRHQVWEIPPIKPEITEYQIHSLECQHCRTTTKGQLPAGVGRGQFGPRLTSLIAMLTGVYRLSKRSIQTLCADVFGLVISTGQVCRLQASTAGVLDPCVQQAREYVATQPANIDETGWKEGLRKCWLWVAVTARVVVYLIRPTRGAKVLHEIAHAEHGQIITSDRAKAYDTWPLELRQLCWSHLRRDFQAMIDRGGPGIEIGEHLLAYSDRFFGWWHRVRDETLSRSTFRRYIHSLRQAVYDELELGAECGCAKTAATCRELIDRESALWTFVYAEGIEPTNNSGEREVRHSVILRKTSFGTDSAVGSRFIENIMTVVATCRRQGRNILEFLTQAHKAALSGNSGPALLP